MTLNDVLADARGDAAVLRRAGHDRQADSIERLCAQVQSAAEDYLVFIPEEDAVLRSGRSRSWFRVRFASWEAEGHAKREDKERLYRRLIVPPLPGIGFVYVIRRIDRVKIGFSQNVRARLEQLQTANDVRLEVIASFRGTLADERAAHRRFPKARLRGEWFRATPALLKWASDRGITYA